MLLFQVQLHAQQFLNLDFEKKSLEHPSRSWGWDGMDSASSVDSMTTYSGAYSLKFQDSTKRPKMQMASFGIEPFELRNKKITLNGYVKTEGLEGKAYISIHDSFEDPKKRAESEKISGTTDWAKFSTSFFVNDSVNAIYFNLNFQGKGIAWFDNFSLSAGGRTYREVQISAPFSKKQVRWLKDHTTPLYAVDALAPRDDTWEELDDLEAFKHMVGTSRLIALGESTHGTSEFFRLKHRVLKYAVHNLGVRLFALEGNMLTVENINQYVLNGRGTAKESMRGIFMVWYNEEVLDMIEWIRNYNSKNPGKKVQFVGYDIQEVIPAIDRFQHFLNEKSPKLLEKHAGFLEALRKNGGYGVASSASKDQQSEWYHKSLEVLKDVRSLEKHFEQDVRNKEDKEQIVWGVQYANLIKQFAENTYRGHLSFYRDKAMAENIEWFLSREDAKNRILIWAHDYHISRGDYSDNEYNMYGGLSMGAHLSKKFGRNYKAFAISTYEGDYRGMISYTNFNSVKCPLYKSPIGTLDEALHQLTPKKNAVGMILNLEKAREEKWLTKPLPMRFANHVNIEYGYWTRYAIPYQFDGIFFIDNTSPAKQL